MNSNAKTAILWAVFWVCLTAIIITWMILGYLADPTNFK